MGFHFALLRFSTRGGLGTVLKEIADQSLVGNKVDEAAIPVHAEVHSVCDIFVYDPLYLANEGKVVLVVDPSVTDEVLSILRGFEEGKEAVLIGKTLDKNIG